jgi:signal transduction histidine kinase
VTLSLRARFTWLAALLVFVVAALVALGGYLAMRASLLDRAAGNARADAARLTGLVDVGSPNGGNGTQVDLADPGLTHELGQPASVIVVARPNGRIIQRSGPPAALPPALFTSCQTAGHASTRLSSPPLTLACDRITGAGTITVGVSLADAFATLRTLRIALIAGVLGGALLAGVLAQLVARRALRPVRWIAETAEEIRAGDLGHRIGYRSSDELGRLAAVLDASFAELEQAVERQRRFGADASHELRTPLAAIRANVELLRTWASTEPAARDAAIASIDQASRRAARLVEDLLYLARADRRAPRPVEPVKLDDVVLGVVREASQLRPEVPIEIVRLDEATVEGEPFGLQQLLLNVLDNALRVSPAGASVEVELAAAGTQVEVSVRDQGPGIAPDELGRIFERLYSHEGSGLGLAIAAAIARDHGGELRAGNDPERGATFTLTLPLRSPAPVSA